MHWLTWALPSLLAAPPDGDSETVAAGRAAVARAQRVADQALRLLAQEAELERRRHQQRPRAAGGPDA